MKIQLYLSAEVIKHFDIKARDVQSDTATPLSANWRALWRCDHIISTEDAKEHLFLFTNAVTHYSLIMVDRHRDFASLLGSFHQHFTLALHEHGHPFNQQSIDADFQLLSGSPHPLIQHMHEAAELATHYLLTNGANIDAAEQRINHLAHKKTSVSASTAMRARIQPYPNKAHAEIVPFKTSVAK